MNFFTQWIDNFVNSFTPGAREQQLTDQVQGIAGPVDASGSWDWIFGQASQPDPEPQQAGIQGWLPAFILLGLTFIIFKRFLK